MAYILTTPALSGANEYLKKYIKIYYRLDDDPTIYQYNEPITTLFNTIHYWLQLGTKVDNKQLEIYRIELVGVGKDPIPTLIG